MDWENVIGPLEGLIVIELAAIGPAPFCAMMLADMGAEVVRIERPDRPPPAWARSPVVERNKVARELDLKSPAGVRELLDLVAEAHVLLDGYRPGVCERLGVGPAQCLARNPSLVFGRMTGWGQTGPYAATPGHDITYLAISGALDPVVRAAEHAVLPVNFRSAGLMLAFGVLCAVVSARAYGRGQMVDAAVLDAAIALGGVAPSAGADPVEHAAPFYDTYVCADGRFVAVGALERRSYLALLAGLGLDRDAELAGDHLARSRWPVIRAALSEGFRARSRDHWAQAFRGTDACVAPVLSAAEAAADPHNVDRGSFRTVDGELQPAPCPRFSAPAPR